MNNMNNMNLNNKFTDNRGKLLFPIKNNEFNFTQCTVSINNKNVLRGIHINQFDKLITCIQGKILDIIINFDRTADNYLVPEYYYLEPNTELFQLFIPKNYGHCFLSLEDNSIIIYHFNGIFSNEQTTHINYLDTTLNISLPISNPILSENDNKPNFINNNIF
jgi:dTDP-4-dehydrorhamnose 3,5-epimerase